MNQKFIDARNLLCPLPVIRTQDGVAGLSPGTLVEVLCTDPGVIHDIPAWCRIHGHEICKVDEQNHLITVTLRIGETS